MSNSMLINKAKEFAMEKHMGQLRKDGRPYIEHPLRVADIVLKYKASHKMEELVVAAILHDTLEDTDTGISELKEKFGETVTLLVVELTSDKFISKTLGKGRYLSKKLSNDKTFNSWALVVKLADRLDNVSDFGGCSLEFIVRYKQETEDIINALEEKRTLSSTHKKLIEEIRKKPSEVKI